MSDIARFKFASIIYFAAFLAAGVLATPSTISALCSALIAVLRAVRGAI
jgi:hypothetical protein